MTDTINTLADPGSDPAHEWQQPENAETILHAITPASLRAHADWFDTTFEPGSVEARSLRNCAARLEAESARDEEAEKLAKVYWHGYRSATAHPRSWDELTGTLRDSQAVGIRAVLDRLAADGRLLPEGGVVTWPEFFAKNQPAPPAVSVPDSGPDGTPEKPWPNLHEVPTSVRKVSDAFGCHWERRQDSGWNRCIGAPQCAAGHPDLAPFVRVDGDKKEGNA